MNGFVAIDFETTAFKDGRNDPWQLGAVVVEDGRTVEMREWFFGTAMTPDYEPIMDQWDSFYPVLAGRPLVAHNIACEKTILTRLAPLTRWGPWVDTMRLAKKLYPRLPGYTLGELCETFGCAPSMEGRTWHDGLYDAAACAALALRLGA